MAGRRVLAIRLSPSARLRAMKERDMAELKLTLALEHYDRHLPYWKEPWRLTGLIFMSNT